MLKSGDFPINEIAENSDTAVNVENEIWIKCRICSADLTRHSSLVAINGESSHFFTNPSGLGFSILTFSDAPGAVLTSVPTAEFSWFTGFTWQLCNCAECRAHIGWYFSPSGSVEQGEFYGFIQDRLRL